MRPVRVLYSPVRRKESRQFLERYCASYAKVCSSLGLVQSGAVLEASAEGVTVYVVDGVPVAFKCGEGVLPTLVVVRVAGLSSTHYAVVDEGAVRPILNGADVMAPGIVEVSDFGVGEVVTVWAPDKRTPLAVTKSLMASSDIVSIRRGKALKNLHHAGDDVWAISLEVLKRFGRMQLS